MKKKTYRILIVIIFLAGLSLLLYPFVANQWNNYRQKQLISEYDSVVSAEDAAGEIDYAAELEKARAYNEALLPSILPDSFAIAEATEGEDKAYMDCLNIAGDGMMGIVGNPKIDIKLPIYHTTREDVLQVAAGHLEGSSLPVGGASTHAVISAHRGLPSASLFTDLDKLEEGDHFLIHVLNETLCYEVDKISVVKPEETSGLAVEEGKDLVHTAHLYTCMVSTSERCLSEDTVWNMWSRKSKQRRRFSAVTAYITNYLLWAIVGLLVTTALLWYYIRKNRS